MAELDKVLLNIRNALDGFENRVRHQLASGGQPVISFAEITDRQAQENEILIGFGRLDPLSDGSGIVLNNKGLSPPLDNFDCITDLVLTGPDDLFAAWSRIVGEKDAPPQRFLQRFFFSVEDASPDSCFGLLCLILRLNGVRPESIHPTWIAYIRDWEMGRGNSEHDPLTEYGSLHNALVHSSIENPAASWIAGLRLMLAALGGDCTPTKIAEIHTPELHRARAFLAYEEQMYEESLRATTPLQLLVPLTGAAKRSRLVDAYIGVESIPVGSLKKFARADRRNAFLKHGFALMAIYRPKADDRGNDFTISVDPDTALDLTLLWQELERREDIRWAGMRPSDNPRPGMIGYCDDKRLDGTPAPNEPWYLQQDRTLVGAPRRLEDGHPGTLLDWNDVRDALWKVYNPFRDVMARPSAHPVSLKRPAMLLHECEAEKPPFTDPAHENHASRRRLLIAGWQRLDNADQVLWRTPTLERYLAALVAQDLTAVSVHRSDLPDASAYDVLELSNGLAVITDRGAFLIESEQRADSWVPVLRGQFFQAEELLEKIENGFKRVEPLFAEVQSYIDGNAKRGSIGDLGFLHLLAHEQFEITRELNKIRFQESPPDADRFREALLQRWGVAGRLEALALAIDQVRAILESQADLTAGRRFEFLQTYGVPLLIAAALVAVVPELFKDKWNPLLLAQTAIAFVIVSIVGMYTIVAASWLVDERARRRRSRALAEHDASQSKPSR